MCKPTWDNANGVNTTGFSAYPAGQRTHEGDFTGLHSATGWRTSTEVDAKTGWFRGLYYCYADISRKGANKEFGLSVRCIKD